MQIKEGDLNRVDYLAQEHLNMQAKFGIEKLQTMHVEIITNYIANYQIVFGREAALQLLQANINGLNELDDYADMVHDAFEMRLELLVDLGSL